MEGTRRVILFVLLVTLSSVIGYDFSFKKKDYLALVEHQKELKNFYDRRSTPIRFFHTDVLTEWVIYQSVEEKQKKEGGAEGIYLVVKKNNKEALPYMTVPGTYNEQREYVNSMSLHFEIVEDKTDSTCYGTLMICFQENKKDPHASCFTTFLFSPPETKEDIHFAKDITETFNPFPEFAMERIAKKEKFKWKLSSLEKVLKGVIKKITTRNKYQHKLLTPYLFRTIIVDKKFLATYLLVANPSREIRYTIHKKSSSAKVEYEAGGSSSGIAQQGEESVEEEEKEKECVEEEEKGKEE